jgi:hypothetical protein
MFFAFLASLATSGKSSWPSASSLVAGDFAEGSLIVTTLLWPLNYSLWL